MTQTDPAPIITPYRIVFFLYTIAAALLALDAVSPEVKSILAIVLLVLSAALTVFFNVAPNTPANPSIVTRVTNRVSSHGEKKSG